MERKVNFGALEIDPLLYNFIANEAIFGTGVSVERFWTGFEQTLESLGEKNRELLQKRDAFQEKLDVWYKAHKGKELSLLRLTNNFYAPSAILSQRHRHVPFPLYM